MDARQFGRGVFLQHFSERLRYSFSQIWVYFGCEAISRASTINRNRQPTQPTEELAVVGGWLSRVDKSHVGGSSVFGFGVFYLIYKKKHSAHVLAWKWLDNLFVLYMYVQWMIIILAPQWKNCNLSVWTAKRYFAPGFIVVPFCFPVFHPLGYFGFVLATIYIITIQTLLITHWNGHLLYSSNVVQSCAKSREYKLKHSHTI